MPYVNQETRELHNDMLEHFKRLHAPFCTVGELNYIITSMCHAVIEKQGLTYTKINEVIGVLECAKLELYRMIAAKYEDKKRDEHGAVSYLDGRSLEDVRKS